MSPPSSSSVEDSIGEYDPPTVKRRPPSASTPGLPSIKKSSSQTSNSPSSKLTPGRRRSSRQSCQVVAGPIFRANSSRLAVSDKDKGRARFPVIDLTLSSSDDEMTPSARTKTSANHKRNGSSSDDSVVALDNIHRPIPSSGSSKTRKPGSTLLTSRGDDHRKLVTHDTPSSNAQAGSSSHTQASASTSVGRSHSSIKQTSSSSALSIPKRSQKKLHDRLRLPSGSPRKPLATPPANRQLDFSSVSVPRSADEPIERTSTSSKHAHLSRPQVQRVLSTHDAGETSDQRAGPSEPGLQPAVPKQSCGPSASSDDKVGGNMRHRLDNKVWQKAMDSRVDAAQRKRSRDCDSAEPARRSSTPNGNVSLGLGRTGSQLKGSPRKKVVPLPKTPTGTAKKRQSRIEDDDEESYRPTPTTRKLLTPASTKAPARPTRVRPEAGAYTLPDPETSIHDWPRSQGTYLGGGSKKRAGPSSQKIQPVHPRSIGSPDSSLSPAPIGSPDSSLSPAPSGTASPSKPPSIYAPRNSQLLCNDISPVKGSQCAGGKTLPVSPTKSLSATPAKRPFPQLLPDHEPRTAIEVDGEEEEEEIEKVEELDPMAVLADFDGYEWASSDEEAVPDDAATGAATADTAADGEASENRPDTETNPPAEPRTSVVGNHVPPMDALASSSQTRANPPTTPRSSQKRPIGGTPKSSNSKRRAMALNYEDMLNKDKERKERARKEEKEMELKVQLQLEKALERREEQEEDEADIGTFLDNIVNVSPGISKKIKSRDNEDREARAEAARQEAKLEAKRNIKTKALRAQALKARRKQDMEFDSALVGLAKGEALEEVLGDMENDDGDEYLEPWLDTSADGKRAYPTPVSGDDDMDVDVEGSIGDAMMDMDLDMDLDSMVHRARKEGVDIDEELVRDAMAAKDKKKHMDVLDWAGFWQGSVPEKTTATPKVLSITFASQPDDMWDLVIDLAKRQDADDLATLFSFGVRIFVGIVDGADLSKWLYENAVYSSDLKWARVARDAFEELSHDSTALPLERSDIHLLRGLASLGASKSILSHHPDWSEIEQAPIAERPIVASKEDTAAFFCHVISSASTSTGERTKSASAEEDGPAMNWIPILLLLNVDRSTSMALGQTIVETVESLMGRICNDDQAPTNFRRIAQAIAKATATQGDDVRAAVLQALGRVTHESREVHKWLGMEYLSPGSLGMVSKMIKPPCGPLLPVLADSLYTIYELLRAKDEPDYTSLNHKVTFLYAASSDPDGLLDQTPLDLLGDKSVKDLLAESDVGEMRTYIRLCRDKISDRANGTHKALVKARLHQLYEITRLGLTLSIKKRVRAKRVGKGLKVGTKGQTRLDFGSRKEAKKGDGVRRKGKGGKSDGDEGGVDAEASNRVQHEDENENEVQMGAAEGTVGTETGPRARQRSQT